MPDGDTTTLSPVFSLCPRCNALLPIPVEVPPADLIVSRGRLSAAGCFVDVSEKGLRTRLRMETPRGVVYRGHEPGRWLTRKGATLLLVGPSVFLALALALGLVETEIEPLLAVGGLLALALAAYFLVRKVWKPLGSLPGRAVRHAWGRMAPRLHAPDFRMDESAFLAGLAVCTLEGDPAIFPVQGLDRAIKAAEQALADGRRVLRHLAPLRRLAVAEAAHSGRDPIPLLAAQVTRCFEKRVPPSFADEMLADWRFGWWTRGNQLRLRLLVCDQAFEAGLEVHHLAEAGQIAPLLGELLQTRDRAFLAQLRLLWSLRASRPWDKCSKASTAFELAGSPGSAKVLGKYPDLLLFQRVPLARPRPREREEDMEQGELVICGRGIAFEGELFTTPSPKIEVFSRGLYKRGGHKLEVGGTTFHLPDDPDPLARMLDRWFRYHFEEFLPQMDEVLRWSSRAGDAILRTWGTVACPKCRQIIRTRPGDVGVALDEASDSPVQ